MDEEPNAVMTEEEREAGIDEALYRLAVGATVDEVGKDADGNTKVFRRKLPPNLEAIKYIRETSRKKKGEPQVDAAISERI